MKTAKSLLIKLFVAAALLLANQSHALTTPYLTDLSNNVAFYHSILSTSTNVVDKAEARALGRALRDLSRPTATVAQDYSRFFLATLHLGKFAFTDPILNAGGVVAFTNFMTDAFVQHFLLTLTNESLNPFVRTKKAASNALVQAGALLQANALETNQSAGLLRGNRIFSKLVQAEKLVGYGLTHQGFAPADGTLEGGKIEYAERGETNTVDFTDATNYIQAANGEITVGTYTYTRTGLNTATIVLTEIGPSGSVTTVKVTFTSTTAGRYAFRFVNTSESRRGAGRFTFSRPI